MPPGKALGSEEGRVMGNGLLEIGSSGKRAEFCCLGGSIMMDLDNNQRAAL